MRIAKNTLLGLIISAFVLIQLANPISVYADDGTDPPLTDTTEIIPPSDTTDPSELETETVDAAVVEPVPSEEGMETGEVISETADAAISDLEMTETVPPEAGGEADEVVLAEVLQEIPENTGVVVLDENNQPVPLATQEAAEIIVNSDPMWCPATDTTVTAACENALTVSGLISKLTLKDVDGVIYFTSAYSTPDATFDGLMDINLALLRDNSLTLQGGWNGDTTVGHAINYSGQSVFSVPVTIRYWQNSLTVNNFSVTGTTSNGLFIDYVQNVSITDSAFTQNAYYGMSMSNVRDVTIADATFDNNGVYGAVMSNVNDVSIINSNFNKNARIDPTAGGIAILHANNVTVSNSNFNENDFGLSLNTVTNNVSIANSAFSQNTEWGTNIYKIRDVSITDSTFNNNGKDGASIDTIHDLTVSGSTINNNGNNGANIESVNDVTISGSTNNNNGGNGIAIIDANDVSIVNGQFNGNTWNTSAGYYAVGAGIGTANHVTRVQL